MAESNFIYYRGFPMVRSGNEIYYGSMGDRFVTKLTIRESEKYKDAEIPTKVMHSPVNHFHMFCTSCYPAPPAFYLISVIIDSF